MRRIAVPLVLASALVLASCSSGGSDAATTTAPDSSTTASGESPASTAAAAGHDCDEGASLAAVQAEPVDGVDSDFTLTSFDDTKIRIHWFPVDGASADEPAPTLLKGPGWSLSGDTSEQGAPLFDAVSISSMHDAGYNVLTWDPRGFGQSEGVATVNDPAFEGRDVMAILDFVAEQPEAQVNDVGDPHVGMVGFSYGGGIQFSTAAVDCRVDVIAPGIGWHSLQTSLYKADTVKTGWSKVLTTTVPKDRLDPHIVSAAASGIEDGSLSDEDREWFISRGPGDLIDDIDIPTLIIQGTVDTLFSLDEGTTNYGIIDANGVPVSMLWFCGGHGTCLTDPGDPKRLDDAMFSWMAKYLKGEDVDTGPRLNVLDQDGAQWTADGWPLAQGEPVTATGAGILELTSEGGSGLGTLDSDPADPLAAVVAGITPTKADNAVNVTIDPGDTDALAIGAPKLSITYTGTYTGTSTGGTSTTDGRIFAQLVDDETGLVVGNQLTPIKVTIDGTSQTAEVDLEIISHHLTPGHTLTLQLVAANTAYVTAPEPGSITFDEITISLPTAAPDAISTS